MKHFILLALLSCAFYSCSNPTTSNEGMTYLGGEIINPKMDQVVLSRDGCILDTLLLDENNHFEYTSTKLEPGLYSFQHGEYQKFFLEPGDSLMLRVNTIDFDESLTYTGRGAERNNLLMEFFLSNEQEHQILQEIAQLSSTEFEVKIDSMRDFRMKNLSEILQEGKESKRFISLAEAAIKYDYYSKKEMYISINKNLERREQIPAAFYNFRKDISFGDTMLTKYYPYFQFLNRHLNNIASEGLLDSTPSHNLEFLRTQKKLDLIDSKITYSTLKDNLLRYTARTYLLNCNNKEKLQQVAGKHAKLSKNTAHVAEITQILNATIKLTPGNILPPIDVVDAENMSMGIGDVIKKPTVIYFWSYNAVAHYKNIHARAAELKERYPEYDFIAINTDTHFRKWRNIVSKNGFQLEREYQFENSNEAEKELVLTTINKALVVNEKGVILESNTNLLKQTFESELLGFLN